VGAGDVGKKCGGSAGTSGAWVWSVAVTPDGKYVVSGSGNDPLILGRDNTVRLWDLATGQEVRRFTGHEDWVYSVAVTPDGQYVVSGSGDKTVRLWDLAGDGERSAAVHGARAMTSGASR
jgi:WD40 repeat protein